MKKGHLPCFMSSLESTRSLQVFMKTSSIFANNQSFSTFCLNKSEGSSPRVTTDNSWNFTLLLNMHEQKMA